MQPTPRKKRLTKKQQQELQKQKQVNGEESLKQSPCSFQYVSTKLNRLRKCHLEAMLVSDEGLPLCRHHFQENQKKKQKPEENKKEHADTIDATSNLDQEMANCPVEWLYLIEKTIIDCYQSILKSTDNIEINSSKPSETQLPSKYNKITIKVKDQCEWLAHPLSASIIDRWPGKKGKKHRPQEATFLACLASSLILSPSPLLPLLQSNHFEYQSKENNYWGLLPATRVFEPFTGHTSSYSKIPTTSSAFDPTSFIRNMEEKYQKLTENERVIFLELGAGTGWLSHHLQLLLQQSNSCTDIPISNKSDESQTGNNTDLNNNINDINNSDDIIQSSNNIIINDQPMIENIIEEEKIQNNVKKIDTKSVSINTDNVNNSKEVASKPTHNFILLDMKKFTSKSRVDGLIRLNGGQTRRLHQPVQTLSLPQILAPFPSDHSIEETSKKPVHIVCYSKHFCGSATDHALNWIIEQMRVESPECNVRFSVGIATCCHVLCDWSNFLGRPVLEERGFTEECFRLLCRMSSWASLSLSSSDTLPSIHPLQFTLSDDELFIHFDSVFPIFSSNPRRELTRLEKAILGMGAKRVLDQARGQELARRSGLSVSWRWFAPSPYTCENGAIFASFAHSSPNKF